MMANLNLKNVLRQLKNAKRSAGGYTALCPAHDDSRNSLSIGEGDDGKVLIHCHAGCSFDDVMSHIALEDVDRDIPFSYVTNFSYTDEQGNLLYQTQKFRPKRFVQRRPDGNGGWVYDLKGVRRV